MGWFELLHCRLHVFTSFEIKAIFIVHIFSVQTSLWKQTNGYMPTLPDYPEVTWIWLNLLVSRMGEPISWIRRSVSSTLFSHLFWRIFGTFYRIFDAFMWLNWWDSIMYYVSVGVQKRQNRWSFSGWHLCKCLPVVSMHTLHILTPLWNSFKYFSWLSPLNQWVCTWLLYTKCQWFIWYQKITTIVLQ